MHLPRCLAAVLAAATLLPAAASATVTFGADLSQPPIDNPQVACDTLGQGSCPAFPTVPSTYAPDSGTVTAVRVRTNARPQGRMQVVVLRSYNRNNLASPGEPYYSCGGGAGGGGGGAGRPPATVPLALPTTATVARTEAALSLLCRLTTACRGTATLELPAGAARDAAAARGRAPTVLGSARFSIRAGRRGSVRVALNRTGRARLRAHRRLPATVVVRLGGRTYTRSLTLKR